MPSMEKQVGVSPLPAVTPPRLQSPSKVGQREAGSKQSQPEVIEEGQETQTIELDTPRKLEDVELQEKDSTIFMTEANLTDLDAIDEEDIEEDEFTFAESRDPYDEVDEAAHESRDTVGSVVSAMSENDEPEEEYDTDLEMEDAEKWLRPELFDRDTTGVNRYLRMCQKLEIQPTTYFLKHMQDTELVMKYHGLGPLGVRAMSDPLEINTTIERMDLEGNYILGNGAAFLAKVLKDNVYVTELILSENRMGNQGAAAICDLLLENKTITYLDLKGNNIGDGVAEDFYDMLSKNTDLKTLILRHNSFEDDGANYLRDALIDNDTLLDLDLSWNHFRWKGCCAIAEGLEQNQSLKKINLSMNGFGLVGSQALEDTLRNNHTLTDLDISYCRIPLTGAPHIAAGQNQGLKKVNLSMNGFGLAGSQALEDTLRNNHTLTDLDISYCRIPLTGAPHIAAGVQNNDTLEKLNIGYNPIQGEGGYVILVALDRNESAPLKYVNFGNLMVKTDFKKLSDALIEERKITILYGGVLLDVTRFRNANYNPWDQHVNDPMTKLKEWLDNAGYRLVDLLLTFDKDKSLTLDLSELKAGIHAAGIPMNDAEIEVLMQKLDDDNSGTIEMRELMHGDELHTLAEREAKKFKEEQDKLDAERRKQMKEGNVKDFQKIIEESDVVKPVSVV